MQCRKCRQCRIEKQETFCKKFFVNVMAQKKERHTLRWPLQLKPDINMKQGISIRVLLM